MSDTSVLLFSPGIDSFLAYHHLKEKNPLLVYYAIRNKYCMDEIDFLRNKKLNVSIDSTFNFADIEEKNSFIPNRNLHFALHAAGKYSPNVYIGGTKSDRVSDNNETIMDSLSDVASSSLNTDVKITSPFWDKHKVELAKDYITDNDPINLLSETFSCYDPLDTEVDRNVLINGEQIKYTNKECLRCKACFRKNVILYNVGIYRHFKNRLIVDAYEKEFAEPKNIREVATIDYIKRLKYGDNKKT